MSVQMLDEHSFIVDEDAEVGYCPVCDELVSLEKFDLVHDAMFYTGIYDPLMVRWSTHCRRCGHHIECCLPFDEGIGWIQEESSDKPI